LSTRSVKREYLGSSARRFTKERRSKAAREEAAAHNALRALRPADRAALDAAGFGAANTRRCKERALSRFNLAVPEGPAGSVRPSAGPPADLAAQISPSKADGSLGSFRFNLRGISRRVSGAVSNQCLSTGPIKTRWDWLGATASASVADDWHALRLTNPRS
jgi:hypothetical protein